MIIKNTKIYTMKSEIIESGYIKIENGKISELGDMSSRPNNEDNVLDLNGLNVYPGFVDAHSHIGVIGDAIRFEGDDVNEESDPSTPHLRAIDAINPLDRCFEEARNAGVTTVATGPGSANPVAGQIAAIKTYGSRVDNMIIKAPVAIKFALGENPKSVYYKKHETPSTRMATASIIREQLIKTKRYYQSILDYENNIGSNSLPEYDAKCDALLPLIKRDIPAHFHAHRADDIFTAVRIAKEFDLDYAIVHGTSGHLIAEELKKDDIKIFSGPFLNERSKPELRDLTPEAPGILSSFGIKVSIITDHPVIPQQYLSVCAALAVREGMNELEALKAITLYPAEFLGISDRVGAISEGMDADLTIYQGDPLDFKSKPKMVICSGEILNI